MPDDPASLLVPGPQHVSRQDPGWRPGRRVRVAWQPSAGEPAWQRLARALAALGVAAQRVDAGVRAEIRCERIAGDGEAESYSLHVGADGVRVAASDGPGLAHGVSTLAQWLRAGVRDGEVAGVAVEDRPDFRHRGVLLDISRNRIPTLPELESLVDLLASLKFDQLQLYMEHSFAYAGHETVWRGFDPLTADDVRHLAAYCAERHVALVPNQNSLGHLHRWLVHEPYRALAECPDGVVHPFSPDPEPFSLCPIDPGSLELLRGLYDQLLPCFQAAPSAGFFNVGLDETLDLGLGRSREACRRLGKHRVYLDFLRQVHELVTERGRRMQFWGDVVLEEPGAILDLPQDAVALAWGYEADHDFDRACTALAASGLEHWVCPGTSSWNSLTGRSRNLLGNVAAAADAGRRHGARGLLLCDWGDHGHLQPPSVSLTGWLAGADRAWNAGRQRKLDDLAGLLDLHVLAGTADAGLGRTLVGLGDVHHLTGAESLNGSALFFQLVFAGRRFAERRSAGLTEEGLAAARSRLAELRPGGNSLVQRELAWSVDLLDVGADLAQVRFGTGVDVPLGQLPGKTRDRLRARFDDAFARLDELWLARSRPGGLAQTKARWRRAVDFG